VLGGALWTPSGIFVQHGRPFSSCSSQVEVPTEYQGWNKSQENHVENDFHAPAWKFQAWKYDCRYLEDHPGTNYVASAYAVNPLGLEFLEKPFHTVLIVLKD
jgi:hypothetical protein